MPTRRPPAARAGSRRLENPTCEYMCIYSLTTVYTHLYTVQDFFFPNSISQKGDRHFFESRDCGQKVGPPRRSGTEVRMYSPETVEAALRAIDEGASVKGAAALAGVSKSAAARWAAGRGVGDLVHLEAASRISRTFRQLVPQKGGAHCLKAHGIRLLPGSARNPDAGSVPRREALPRPRVLLGKGPSERGQALFREPRGPVLAAGLAIRRGAGPRLRKVPVPFLRGALSEGRAAWKEGSGSKAGPLAMPIRQEMDGPVRGSYLRATRSLWSMRWMNAAMSQRAIMP